MTTFKMQVKKGVFTLKRDDGSEIYSGDLNTAIHIIFALRDYYKTLGHKVSTNLYTLYPVRSLMPPLKEKNITFYMLEEEIA